MHTRYLIFNVSRKLKMNLSQCNPNLKNDIEIVIVQQIRKSISDVGFEPLSLALLETK